MHILALIGQLFKVIFFFLSLWGEKNTKKANEKNEIWKDIGNAAKTTNPKTRASRLNTAIERINRV